MPEIWFPNLGIKINKLSRIAFSIFNIDIYWYGIIIAIGIFLGFFITLKEAKRTNQNPDNYTDCFLYTVVISIIFARAYYVIFSFNDFKHNLLSIFAIRNGGIAIYGAIIGGILSCYVYCKIKKINLFQLLDTCVMGLLVGQILGRWGNFINREAFGTFTDNLFAMRYLISQVSYIPPSIKSSIIDINGSSYIQVHPTFLYESIWNIGVFLIIFLYRKNKKFHGELTSLYFILYGIGRFWIEGLRIDSLIIPFTNIAVSQALSLILVIIFIIYILIKRKKLNKSIDI